MRWIALVGISTVTSLTPASLPTRPSMACWQCSHEMSGAIRVVDSMLDFLLMDHVSSLMRVSVTYPSNAARACSCAQAGRQLLITCNGVELNQFLDHGFFTTTFDAFWDTGPQVSLDNNRLQFLQRLAHRMRLMQDVNTVLILLHHLA